MAVTKRKRAHKVSNGVHGATKHPLTPLDKVLAGKGQYASLRHVECKNPWRGMASPATPVFDPEQARENRRLYPHLFDDKARR